METNRRRARCWGFIATRCNGRWRNTRSTGGAASPWRRLQQLRSPVPAGHDRGPFMMLITHVHVHVKAEFIEAFKEATVENARQSVLESGVARFDVIQRA